MIILITGESCMIGSHIVEHYQGIAEEIRVLDHLRTRYCHNLDGFKHTFIEGFVTDRKLVRESMQDVDNVFYLAAMASAPESLTKPRKCVDINVLGLIKVQEHVSVAGVAKLVFASSAPIYGDDPTVPKVEVTLSEPNSTNAITKIDGEYYLCMFQHEGRLETAALRLFNVFGERQDPKGIYAGPDGGLGTISMSVLYGP